MSILSGLITAAATAAKAASAAASKNKSSSNSANSSSGSSSSGSSGGSSGSSYMGGYYDSGTDYQAKINEAVNSGNMSAAAQYEQMRNNKIKNEGLNYGTTDRFSQYLPTSSQAAAEDTGYIPGQSLQSGSKYINQMYDAQRKAQIDALNSQYAQFKAENEAQQAALPQQYQTARNQSELERYKSQKALNEQMANSGTTYSGQGRQDTLGNQNAAATRLTSINTSEQDALAKLKQALAQAQLQRDSGITQANANLDASQAQAMLQDLYQQQTAQREDYWNQKNYGLSEAGLTGIYNGSSTLQKQAQDYQQQADQRDYELQKLQLDDQLATNQITRAQYQEQLKTLQRQNAIGEQYDAKMQEVEYQSALQALQNARLAASKSSSKTNTGSYQRQSSGTASTQQTASAASSEKLAAYLSDLKFFPSSTDKANRIESLLKQGLISEEQAKYMLTRAGLG